MLPLSIQRSALPESNPSPLLDPLLKGNTPDFKSCFSTSTSSSEKTNSNIALNTSSSISNERHWKSLQVRRASCSQKYVLSTAQNQSNFEGIHCIYSQHNVSPSSLSCQPSTDKVFADQEVELCTNDQICHLIADKVSKYRSTLSQQPAHWNKSLPNEADVLLKAECKMLQSNSVVSLCTTSGLSCAMTKQCTTATGELLEKHSLNISKATSELTPKSKDKGDPLTSQKHLKEHPQIIWEVPGTCTKNEVDPMVLTTVSGMAWDELTEKDPSSTLDIKSSQEEYKSLVNANKNLDSRDGVSDASCALKSMTRKKEEPNVKQVQVMGLNTVSGVTSSNRTKDNAIKDQQHCSVLCKAWPVNSMLNQTIDTIRTDDAGSVIKTQTEQVGNKMCCRNIRDNVALLCSQVDVSIILSESKLEDDMLVTILKDPQYEDISDAEDMSELTQKLPKPGLYKSISEDKNLCIQNLAVKISSPLPELSEPSLNQHMLIQAQMKSALDSKIISKKETSLKMETFDRAQHCTYPCYVETDDDSEYQLCPQHDHKRDLGWRTNHSHKPCDVLKGEQEIHHQPDDDDWVVIPVRMLNFKFERTEDQYDPENGLQHECPNKDSISSTLCEPAPKPVPASAFSQMEIFDTPVQQEQALNSGQLSFVVPSSCGDHEQKLHTLQNRKKSCSEAEDSCETEDSCDYSSGPECNYLTVSKLLLKNLSAPMQPKVDDSEFEKENENDEAMNLLKSQTRTRQKCSKKVVIINLDSGNESDKNYTKKTRRKRLSSPCSGSSGATTNYKQRRSASETVNSLNKIVKENFQKTITSSASSSSASHNQFQVQEEWMHNEVSYLSQGTEKCKFVQNEVSKQKVLHNKSAIIILSDSDD